VVANSYEVDEESRTAHQNWQEQRTQQHLLDPQLALLHNPQNNIPQLLQAQLGP